MIALAQLLTMVLFLVRTVTSTTPLVGMVIDMAPHPTSDVSPLGDGLRASPRKTEPPTIVRTDHLDSANAIIVNDSEEGSPRDYHCR